jgi:MGT family glycosyltransferase
VVNLFLSDVRREASALRRAYGLPPLRIPVTDFAGQMPLYLVPSSPEFDYQRDDLPPSVHYVGPCLWSKLRHEPSPEWLNQLPPDRTLVYVSEGTVHLQSRVLRAAAQGLANLPVQVIMTTGRHRDPAKLHLGPRPLAPNIRVEQWVPLDDLLPRLDAMVTIGGPGTLLAALQAGIPVVIVPFDWDHPETGWHVTNAGVGIRVAPKECTPERLREAVERVLHDPSFRQNAQRLAATFARCGGPTRAAELLESLVPTG